MRSSFHIAALVAVLGLASAAFAAEVDNPVYQSWARFKPGTTVTLKQTAIMTIATDLNAETLITQKLLDVKPEAVTLEVTLKTTIRGQETQNTSKTRIPAKVEKGREFAAQSGPDMNVEMSRLKEGTDTIEIKGAKVSVATREFSLTLIRTPAAPSPADASVVPAVRAAGGVAGPATSTVKIWTAPEVPGGTARVEQNMALGDLGNVKTVMNLVDYAIAR